MLKGKKIVLGVTGGIAVYKAVDLVSKLRKQGAEVRVVMTEHAQQFVTPLTFKEISGNKVAVSIRNLTLNILPLPIGPTCLWLCRQRPTSLPKWYTALPMICFRQRCLRHIHRLLCALP